MKPIYFPFTTISEPVLGALLTCFEQVVIYQPSRNHVPESLLSREAGGRLQIHLPDEDENDPLPRLLKAYHAWALLHEGERPDFEKFHPPQPPYTDAAATSRIRSDIQKAVKGTGTTPSLEEKERSMLLRARLFLTVAQEHDQLRQALREDLDRIEDLEKDLFRDLVSDQDEPFPMRSLNRPAEETEVGCYMSGARMTAWTRLHVHFRKTQVTEAATRPKTPNLLITSDRFALEHLLAQAEEAEMICSVSGIPFRSPADTAENVFFNEQRCEKLRALTAESTGSPGLNAVLTDAGSRSGSSSRLTIYRLNEDAVMSFLFKSGNRSDPPRRYRESAEKQYILAGSIIQEDPWLKK
jgi:hypothetical protein